MKTITMSVFILVVAGLTSAQIPPKERAALIALYNATDGPNWNDNSGWELGALGTECTWAGITCSGGHVTGIDLCCNDLNGMIPDEIGDLSFLTRLQMVWNNFTGGIPAAIGNIDDLEQLLLFHCGLDGSIPPGIGNLVNLRYIHLADNRLSGSLPPEMAKLISLEEMNLIQNQIGGTIPVGIGNLPNLRYLRLSLNLFEGTIPPNLGNLTGLLSLDLSGTLVSGEIPPELGQLSSLEILSLSDNHLTGPIPPELGNLTNVTHFNLSRNRLSGTLPSQIGDLVSLTSFFIENNSIRGPIPETILNWTSLDVSGGAYVRKNALWTDSALVKAFLDSRDSSWEELQTSPPTNVAVEEISNSSITVTWTPIAYMSDPGGYWVVVTEPELIFSDGFEFGDTSAWGGLPPSAAVVNDKNSSSMIINGLSPATDYRIVVRSFTNPTTLNKNLVISDSTPPVFATTVP